MDWVAPPPWNIQNIKEKLKKSILQYAIEGKLVPQDPNDEPASVLLERIRKEKQKLIGEGKIKKDKTESIIYRRDNSYYEMLDKKVNCIDDKILFEAAVSEESSNYVDKSLLNVKDILEFANTVDIDDIRGVLM